MVINRISANTMEPRVCIGDYDQAEDRYTLYAGTQRPHQLRRQLAEEIFHIRENQIRVVGSDVGGSFGMKSGQNPEYRMMLWASRLINRPVRWLSDRSTGVSGFLASAAVILTGSGSKPMSPKHSACRSGFRWVSVAATT